MKRTFDAVFKKRRAFLPVIHVANSEQAIEQAGIALDNGADGVFLINHATGAFTLMDACRATREQFPSAWIGVNCLGWDILSLITSMILPEDIDGIWSDCSNIPGDEQLALQTWDIIVGNFPRMLYFGGVAFKYQGKVADVANAARVASNYMDVVTTSGDETGIPPSPDKIRVMSDNVGDKVLGIASGVSEGNVQEYPEARCFLVATSISKDFNHLDPDRVARLAKIVERMN